MNQLLHNKALVKPARPDYIRFRQVGVFSSSIPCHQQQPGEQLLLFLGALHAIHALLHALYMPSSCVLQLMGPAGIPDLVTAESDPNDWLWRTVRKGVAPAFAAQAMRSATA